MKLTIEKYKTIHLAGFIPRQEARDSIDEHGGLDAVMEIQTARGPVFSILAENRTIGIVGAWPAGGGVAEVWTMFSDESANYPFAVVKAVDKILCAFYIGLSVKMFYALVKDKEGVRWGRIHGFKAAGKTPPLSPNGEQLTIIYRRAA